MLASGSANTFLPTRLTSDYGLDFPFVSAGMGFVALPELVAAVSHAGGLGLLGSGPAPPPVLQQMIQRVKRLTPRPFGVDFVHDDTSFGPATTDAHIDACISEGVKLVVFFWNLPPKTWMKRLRESGARVWYQVSSIENAKEAVDLGVSAIIAQGSEAGGHNRSEIGLFALLPAMRAALPEVPLIAAGGIADGRGVAAALTLGADGVCIGTRLLASTEANIHREYQARVVAAECEDVARTCIFGPEWPDQPTLALRNRVVREWAGRDDKTPSQPQPPTVIGQTDLFGHLYSMPKFSAALPTPETTGDFEEMCLAAGRGVGLVNEIKPASEIVREMMTDAAKHLRAHDTKEWLQTRPGEECLIHVSAADTGDRYSLVEIVSKPGDATPLHRHETEDEYMFVLEGSARIAYGEKIFDAQAGDVVTLRKGIPHAWGNRSDADLRIAMLARPAGIERILRLIPSASEADLMALVAELRITVLSPAPF